MTSAYSTLDMLSSTVERSPGLPGGPLYWPLRAYPGFLIEGEYGHVNVSNRGDCARVRDPGWLPVVASCDNLVLEAH